MHHLCSSLPFKCYRFKCLQRCGEMLLSIYVESIKTRLAVIVAELYLSSTYANYNFTVLFL